MCRHYILAAAIVSLCGTTLASPKLQWSQDNVHYTNLRTVNDSESAADYYDLFNHSGHPRYGTAPGLCSTAMYFDTSDKRLSFMLSAGHDQWYSPFAGRGGRIKMRASNLPSFATLELEDGDDDAVKIDRARRTASARFGLNRQADGVILGRFDRGDFLIRIDLDQADDIARWRLLDGGRAVVLDMDKPLFIRTAAQAPTQRPIPPGTIEMLARARSVQGPFGRPGTTGPGGPGVPEPSSVGLIVIASAMSLRRLSLRRSCQSVRTTQE